MASKPTFRESLIYSPFNNRTPLLAKEYFTELNTFVCLIIVVTFRRFFFFFLWGGGGGGTVLNSRVMLVLRETS